MYRFSPEARGSRRRPNQSHGARQIKIHELAAGRTERMIVPIGFPIVAARSIAEGYFANQALIS